MSWLKRLLYQDVFVILFSNKRHPLLESQYGFVDILYGTERLRIKNLKDVNWNCDVFTDVECIQNC